MSSVLLTLLILILHSHCENIDCNGDCNCPGESLGITCRLDCTQGSGCLDGRVKCRTADPCIVDCRGPDVCGGNTNIDASDASDVTIYCGPDNGCKGNVHIICGTGDCIINCDGSSSCQGADIIVNRAHSYQCIGQCDSAKQAKPPYSASPTKPPSPTPTKNPIKPTTNNPTLSPTPAPTTSPTYTPSPTVSLEPSPTASPALIISSTTTWTPTVSPIIYPIVFQNITRVIDVYGGIEDDEKPQKSYNGLMLIAITLSVACFCIFCVGIPAFVCDTKRKSKLMEEIKGEDIEQRVDGLYTLANNKESNNNKGNDVNDDDNDSNDDIYDKGIGPPPVTSAMLRFLKERHHKIQTEDDEKMEEIKVHKTPNGDDETGDDETDDDEESVDDHNIVGKTPNIDDLDMTE